MLLIDYLSHESAFERFVDEMQPELRALCRNILVKSVGTTTLITKLILNEVFKYNYFYDTFMILFFCVIDDLG